MAIQFWKDGKKPQINPDLFSSIAEKLALDVASEKGGNRNKPTQIRKFYDEVIRFDSIVKASPKEFDNVLPYLKMLNAKAAYAMGRDLISGKFKDFIADSLHQVNDKQDFAAFTGLFEAFIGYYKFHYEKTGLPQRGGAR
ncbi:MAG: type III-A CRISPR-associated protein Csm2 [Deltaproteobacteria bacterium]|nr:type III-A CRISPR-associated protein Csm2 [Deltaproteobacteria bacterium]